LDEAQMVESVTARATEMALSLRAFHRWCVSGTPIQRGLDDLFGLLRFLGAEPFDDYRWWSLALKQPYEVNPKPSGWSCYFVVLPCSFLFCFAGLMMIDLECNHCGVT
jgi:hypothetical protein